MPSAHNSFDILPDLAARMPRINTRWLWWWRICYGGMALWRHTRISKPLTWLLGPQYRPSRDLIEIDITYKCNLHCLNCNRSCTQAPSDEHMSLGMVGAFVDESIQKGRAWRRIRVLGGEPTLHPEFDKIIFELLRYKAWRPSCIVEVVTNGYGQSVNQALARLPKDVMVDNSAKTGPVQTHFGPFNLAPIDDLRYFLADYGNACAIARDCGMGITPQGYYPCAVAGGIDRIVNLGLGAKQLPDEDMQEVSRRLCGYCGRFRDGHFVPRLLRSAITDMRISATWTRLYESWAQSDSVGEVSSPSVNGEQHQNVKPKDETDDSSQAA